jgi:uncharacterized Rmd1/YagE family protein
MQPTIKKRGRPKKDMHDGSTISSTKNANNSKRIDKVTHSNGMVVVWKYDYSKFKDGLYEVEIFD